MYRRILVLGLLALAAFQLSAQSNVADLASTRVGGVHAANTDGSPWADMANPAASAGLERFTLDLNYHLLTGLGVEPGTGHWVNLGASIPSNVGVFTVSGRFVTASFPSLNLGTFGDLRASFAKDLYDDLYFGVGINGQFGSTYTGNTDWGLAADLGFIHLPGDLGFMQDFTWGVAMRGLGKGYPTSLGTVPAIFTPAIAASFKLLDEKDVRIGFATDLSFPTFQNLVWKAGFDAEFFRVIGIQVGADLDVAAMAAGRGRSLPLNFGLTARLGGATEAVDEQGQPLPFYKTSEFRPSLTVAPLAAGIWDFGLGLNLPIGVNDTKAPVIKADAPETAYISPDLNGVQDDFVIPVKVSDERYVQSFTFTIYNAAGEVVRVIRNKEQRPEADTFDSLAQRFVRVKAGVVIPDPLTWDGTDDQGQQVPDGTYTWSIEAIDDNGNVSRTVARSIVVDTSAPALTISIPADNPNKAFSPKGDRPSLSFDLSSSPEDRWSAEIYDARSTLVKRLDFDGILPLQASWDGSTSAGEQAPDGVYSIRLASTDRAGNTGVSVLDNVLLISEPTPVAMRASTLHFSPNGDKVKDDVTVTILSNPKVRVENYRLVLRDSKGDVVRSKEGSETLPGMVRLLDKGNAESAPDSVDFLVADGQSTLQEGQYTLALEVLYINGNRPSAEIPSLTLDLSAPTASVSTKYTIFSPNADGRKDSVELQQQSSNEPEWKALVRDSAGATVRSWTWNGVVPASLEWDGRNDAGAIAPDGRYTYQLAAVDQAGNMGQSAPLILDLDQRSASVEATLRHRAFSPNNDKIQDTQAISLKFLPATDVATWKITIQNAVDGATVHQAAGEGAPPATWEWNGMSGRETIKDGSYRARVELEWTKGDLAQVVSPVFELDTVAPVATVKTPVGTDFSPDSDGVKDALPISQTSSSEELWTATIFDDKSNIVRRWTYAGEARDLEWDARDEKGQRLSAGTFRYELASQDPAGNRFATAVERIRIDTQPRDLRLEASLGAFSPNNDKVQDSIEFKPVLTRSEGIASWKLDIVRAGDNASSASPVATITPSPAEQGKLPPAIAWNGRNGSTTVAEGSYQARLSVTFSSGQAPFALSSRFVLDITPPAATAFATDSTFSPDGDGRKDKVVFDMKSAESARWTARILGSAAAQTELRSQTWNGALPPRSEWDGLDARNSPAADGRYIWQLSGTDEAGNSAILASLDLVVDKRQPTLALKLPNAAFSPNADGVKDRLVLNPELGLRDGVDSWTVEIRASGSDAVVWSNSQKGLPPTSIEWDGKNSARANAADGTYRATLSVLYLKGNQPSTQSDSFVLDTRAPTASLKIQNPIFSPEGDGFGDALNVEQSSSAEELWNAEMSNAAGTVVRRWTWKGQLGALAWDGLDENGKQAADGSYSYAISSTDPAGNRFSQKLGGIVIDRRDTPLRLAALGKGLNPPSKDATLRSLGFQTFVDLNEGIESWTLRIVNERQETVRTINGRGNVPARLEWNGLADGDKNADDGRYEARLALVYTKGNRPQAASGAFVLDTRGPTGTLGFNPQPFSPDDDGVDDELAISLGVQDISEIRDWKLEIIDPEGEAFTDFSGRGSPTARIVWNGRSRNGQTVESAMDYSVRLTLTDIMGNSSVTTGSIPVDVLVVRDGNLLRIRLPGITFPDNSSDLLDRNLDPAKLAQNRKTLDRLADILKRYSSYRITVEGHANITALGSKAAMDNQQSTILIPLSKRRAESVRLALIARGIAANRLDSIGVGGANPLVEFTDAANRWKNRRVEFILRK